MNQHLSPDACPLRTSVTIIGLTDPETGVTRDHEIEAGNGPAQAALTTLMMNAVSDPSVLDSIGGTPRKTQRHPQDCPLCALHARPGPRVWGSWMVDAWYGDPIYQYTDARAHHGIELFASAAHAREIADQLYQLWKLHGRTNIGKRIEVTSLHAYIDSTPRLNTRLITEGSQLWLWNHEPRRWWPDQVLSFGQDGIEEMTGTRIQVLHETGQIPSGVLGDPPPPHRPDHLEIGDLVIRAISSGSDVHVVSIWDRSSTMPARRVLSGGKIEPLGETTRGLTVYGHYIGDRPPVERIAHLTPEYTDVIPTVRREFIRTHHR